MISKTKIKEDYRIILDVDAIVNDVDAMINNKDNRYNPYDNTLSHEERGLLLEYKINLIKSLVQILNPRNKNVTSKRNKSKRRSRNK